MTDSRFVRWGEGGNETEFVGVSCTVSMRTCRYFRCIVIDQDAPHSHCPHTPTVPTLPLSPHSHYPTLSLPPHCQFPHLYPLMGCVTSIFFLISIFWFSRILLWDCDNRSYSFYVAVSTDNHHWTKVVDKTDENCRFF